MQFLLRLLINAFALWLAARFIDGINYAGSWQGLVGLALVFGFVNAFIRPILNFLSFPVRIITLGLFTLVINALMLMLTARIAGAFDIAFTVRGFFPALWGAIFVSLVSMVLTALLVTDKDRKRDRDDDR
jgi:putative membrane protein